MREFITEVDDVGIYHKKEEFVRCKDCIHFDQSYGFGVCMNDKLIVDGACVISFIDGNFHCGYAERKE